MLEINGTCLVFVLSFLLFVLLLNQTLWRPIAIVKKVREADLLSEQEKAIDAESKTQSILEQVSSEIEEIKKREHTYLDGLLKDFTKKRELEEIQLKSEMEESKKRAYEQIMKEGEAFKSSLQGEAEKLAHLIVARVAPEVSLQEGTLSR